MAKNRLTQLEERVQAIQEIALQLISARDNTSLLSLIVERATHLTDADAAALYLQCDTDTLEFVIAINHSLQYPFQRQKIRIDSEGIAAYVFRSRQAVRIPDAYAIPKELPFHFDPSFDKKTGYRTKSILAVPLVTSKNQVMGVLQLINKKGSEFSDEDAKLILGFGALASASIEKTTLYENIEKIFEGFLHASVKVIDERDPSTGGHSERVALMTRELAVQSNKCLPSVALTDQQIREIYYASLLHDFGKVGVREAVLLKPEKLFIDQLLRIQLRHAGFRYQSNEALYRKFIDTLYEDNRPPNDLDRKQLEKALEGNQRRFEDLWQTILRFNQPQILTQDLTAKMKELTHQTFSNGPNEEKLLTEEELSILSIPKGSLTNQEKKEIEDHVSKTYRFLREIPWSKDFSNLAEIAYAHHEKLDGTGYPRQLKEPEIPIQSKMMSICDIYDALVAADRPYKASLPPDKALDILKMEVKSGKLDGSLLEVFIEAKIPGFIQSRLPQQSHKKSA